MLKLENNNNYYEEGKRESSKPKGNIPSDESNVKTDSIQEIDIGYPAVDTDEFKKLKNKAKIKKIDIDENTIEHNNISQEDKN